MKKRILIFFVLIIFLALSFPLYSFFNSMDVVVDDVTIRLVDDETSLNACIRSKQKKEEIRNNPTDYYDVWLNLSVSNPHNISYNRWRFYSKNTHNDMKVWVNPDRREGYSLITPGFTEDGVGLVVIIYAPNSDIESVEAFVKEDLELYALGYPDLNMERFLVNREDGSSSDEN